MEAQKINLSSSRWQYFSIGNKIPFKLWFVWNQMKRTHSCANHFEFQSKDSQQGWNKIIQKMHALLGTKPE